MMLEMTLSEDDNSVEELLLFLVRGGAVSQTHMRQARCVSRDQGNYQSRADISELALLKAVIIIKWLRDDEKNTERKHADRVHEGGIHLVTNGWWWP